MKFYSEKLCEMFDTQEECEKKEAEFLEKQKKAEEEKEKLQMERKARAQEVEDAKQAMIEAQKNYKKVFNDFCRDYNTYHYSVSNFSDATSIVDFLEKFF